MYENGVQVYSSTAISSVNSALGLVTTVAAPLLVVEGRECPRYQPNRGHLYSSAGWFPLKFANGVREWGLFTPYNGVFFRLKSDGLLYAVRWSAGVEVYEALINTSAVPGFDVEKNNVYDIQFQWRSAGNYWFYINLVLVHTTSLLGTLAALSMENPALPAAFRATRGTEDVSMFFGCVDITSENGRVDREVYESAYAENVATGMNTPVLVLHQPLLIAGQTNTRTISLARIFFTNTKKATFKVWTTRTATDIVGATYATVGPDSFVTCDSPDMAAGAVQATSVVTANLTRVLALPVPAGTAVGVANPYQHKIEYPLVRGDYLIVTCTAPGGVADVAVEWGEQV